MKLTEETKIFEGIDGNEFPMDCLIKHIDEPIRKQILENQEIVERLKDEINEIDRSQHEDPRKYNGYCIECNYKQKLNEIILPTANKQNSTNSSKNSGEKK